jgi:hypothetical protein
MSTRIKLLSTLTRRLSLDGWAVSVAVAFILFILAGLLPRVPW